MGCLRGVLAGGVVGASRGRPLLPTHSRRAKEGDKVTLLAFPTAPQLLGWKHHTRQEVVAVSGRGKAAFAWLLRAEAPGVTEEELLYSGEEMESLDAKLGAAATKILKGEPGRRIMQRVNDLSKIGVINSSSASE